MKEQLLWLYRQVTRSQRYRLLDTLRYVGQVPVGILFYHRVADTHSNPWTLSRSDFSRQLDWLQKYFDIVDLEEAQRRVRMAHCEQPTVSITFDDGYSENADFAIPELVQRKLPATYFVSTDFVRTGTSFPHDLEAGTALAPNTIAQLREFAEQGIEIGAHTRTHADLGQVHEIGRIVDEILGSVHDLEDWLGRAVRYFAFPFGQPENITQAAVDVVGQAGLAGFCSAYGAWNWPNSMGFHLRRIHADPKLEKLKNWLTYDSRKLREQVVLPFVEPRVDRRAKRESINREHCFQTTLG